MSVTSIERPRPLTDDERRSLIERLTGALGDVDARIAAHWVLLRDTGPDERETAVAALDALQRQARAHARRLRHLRSGGPTCRGCGRLIGFDVLGSDPLAAQCHRCTPDHRPRTGWT